MCRWERVISTQSKHPTIDRAPREDTVVLVVNLVLGEGATKAVKVEVVNMV